MNLIHPKYQLNQNFFASISVRGDSPIGNFVYKHVDIYFLDGWQARAVE